MTLLPRHTSRFKQDSEVLNACINDPEPEDVIMEDVEHVGRQRG